MPFTVLRIQKLKTWGDIAGAGKHNQRERETPNADTARTTANQHLVGTPGMDNVAAVKEAIGAQRVRKNAVLGVEMLLSASPAYFRPENPELAGIYDNNRLQNWKEATMGWLNKKYGNRVVSAILHVDESTPHIHALLGSALIKTLSAKSCIFRAARRKGEIGRSCALAVGELVSRTDKDSSQAHENLSGEIAVAIRKPLCGNGYRIEHTARSISFLQRSRTEKGGFAAGALMRAEPSSA